MCILRTVPTKYKGFRAKLGPRGKSRSLQGLFDSTKKNKGSHVFFKIISLESQQNADISIFLKKVGNDISSHISLEFAFTYRKANTFKLHGKW